MYIAIVCLSCTHHMCYTCVYMVYACVCMVYFYYILVTYTKRYTQDRRKRRHAQLSNDCSTSILQAEEFAKSYLLHNTSPSTNQQTLTSSSSSSTSSSNTSSFFKMFLTLYDESTCELDQALAAIAAHSDRASTGDGGEADSKRARLEASTNHNSSSSANTNSNGHASSSSSSGPLPCRCTPLKLAVKRLCTQLLVLEKDSVKFHGDKCCSHYFGLMQDRFWAILGDEGVERRCSEDTLLMELKSKTTAMNGAAVLCSPSSSSSSSSNNNNNSSSSEGASTGRQLLQRIHDQLATEIQVSILLISTLQCYLP